MNDNVMRYLHLYRNIDDQRSNAESSVNYGELEADATEDTISRKKRNIKLKDLRSVSLKQVKIFWSLVWSVFESNFSNSSLSLLLGCCIAYVLRCSAIKLLTNTDQRRSILYKLQ